MKNYINPVLELVKFDISDVIASSSLTTEEEGEGGNLDFNV